MATSTVKAEFVKLEGLITESWPTLANASDILSNYITFTNGVPSVTTPATNPDPFLVLILKQLLDDGIVSDSVHFIQPLADDLHIKEWWQDRLNTLTDMIALLTGLSSAIETYTTSLPPSVTTGVTTP
jgi:hypothetical protein